MYERPIPERHRIVFYVGHLEAFDWNLLHENVLGLKSFHPEFDRLFAFGIDPVGADCLRTNRQTGRPLRLCATMSRESVPRWTRNWRTEVWNLTARRVTVFRSTLAQRGD